MSHEPIARNWSVKKPSREYLSLPPEIRDKIDRYLREFPVKLGGVAKELGVSVLLSTLPRGISGKISQENGEFVIRINRHEAKHRQRFTLAHELAHFLLHKDRIISDGGWSENVLLRAPNQPIQIEYEANRLASDFVVPSDLLSAEMERYPPNLNPEHIEELAQRFGVSTTAMEIKLQLA